VSIYQASVRSKGYTSSSCFVIQNHIEQMRLQERTEDRVVYCWTGKEAVSTFFNNINNKKSSI